MRRNWKLIILTFAYLVAFVWFIYQNHPKFNSIDNVETGSFMFFSLTWVAIISRYVFGDF